MGIHNTALIGASSQGYQISRSVRLRSSATADLSRTPATASNKKTWTYSSWMKRGSLATIYFFGTNFSGTGGLHSLQLNGDALFMYVEPTAGVKTGWLTSAVFRDPSAWYHVQVVFDTTQAAVANMGKIYVNGILQTTTTNNYSATYIAQNADGLINGTTLHTIGSGRTVYTGYFDGYIAETNFIDGQALTPSSFGQYNANGVWSPIKYTGTTYGTNGFYLNFSDNSAATAAAIGKDNSGNGNNWTPNNISVTAGVTYDSMLDVPTPYADGGNGRGNYCVLNTVSRSTAAANAPTPTSGNLEYAPTTAAVSVSGWPFVLGTIGITNGKWYFEVDITGLETDSAVAFGFVQPTIVNDSDNSDQLDKIIGAIIRNDSASTGLRSAVLNTFVTRDGADATNAVYQIAIDNDLGKLWIGKANTWYASGNPSAGTGEVGTFTSQSLIPFAMVQKGNLTANSNLRYNFGQRPFTYTPPTDFVALNTQNLSTPTIPNGAAYMAATTYTGTGATQTITNTVNSASFQPDWVWVKGRSGATDHALYDSVRGATFDLAANSAAAETVQTTGLTAFGSTGFTVGALAKMNTSAATYVGWQWKAGGTAVTNTSGTISSQVSAGATQGFSVVTYTGTGANATVGHGLGVAPKMVIVKSRSINPSSWSVYTSMTGAGNELLLNSTAASAAAVNSWNSTAPSSSVFTVGTAASTNQNTSTYVAYCFSEVAGYSAFGSYTGNGLADGTFVYLGFRPRFVMIKRTDGVTNWSIKDSSVNTYNAAVLRLYPNVSDAETSGADLDYLSNGFKCRTTSNEVNAAGTYIYMAFAENPFKYSLAR